MEHPDSLMDAAARLPDRDPDERPDSAWRRWSLALLGWTAVGLFFANRLFFTSQWTDTPVSWTDAVSWSFLDWYLWAALSPIIFKASARFGILRRASIRNVLVHLSLSLLLTCLHSAIYGAIVWKVRWVPQDSATITELAQGLFFGKFHMGVVTYWVLVLLHHALDYYRRYREKELRVSRMEAQLATAQLQALRMQLQPHFLFNTLNAVSALMHRDVNAAETMLARLSDFLRLALETGTAVEVPLKQELEFLEHYLYIEQTRFADRLQVSIHADRDAMDASVPNLILQPIVENAIRHGIARSSTAGRIEIAAHRENGSLLLRVTDDGPGLPRGGVQREGVGLTNTRARIRQLYGAASRLQLENASNGGTDVQLVIPYRAVSLKPETGGRVHE
ncbi:MAG: ATPase [Gemmatimonadota bacterium]|nr:MAG: ATPase [Gemmatimonadota bacterium]